MMAQASEQFRFLPSNLRRCYIRTGETIREGEVRTYAGHNRSTRPIFQGGLLPTRRGRGLSIQLSPCSRVKRVAARHHSSEQELVRRLGRYLWTDGLGNGPANRTPGKGRTERPRKRTL
jgi:hypothetical protein